jgi:hypothetical protein
MPAVLVAENGRHFPAGTGSAQGENFQHVQVDFI